MADQFDVKETLRSPAVLPMKGAETIEAGAKKRTLRGMLMMAICCAAPLLLLAAIPFLAATFGSLAALGTGLLNIVALLACPVGMYLMMRMMTKDKK